MEYDTSIAELFEREDLARDMARRLMDVAQRSLEAAAAERAGFLAFLRGPMEQHMRYEEEHVFPALERHELAPEVAVARKHHALIREGAARLAGHAEGEVEAIARTIFELARYLHHHTSFEGDYIYPELTREAWHRLLAAIREGDPTVPAPAEGEATGTGGQGTR